MGGNGHNAARQGVLVAVTGIDGSGKSAQVARLASRLQEAGTDVATGSWRIEAVEGHFIGDLVARVAKADLDVPVRAATLLLAANLAYRVERRIAPALASGHAVVEDDYHYKMRARARAHGLDAAWVDGLFSFAPRPDVAVLLDVEPDAALARLGRPVTNFESGFLAGDRDAGFLKHQRDVRAQLLDLADAEGLVVVRADGPEGVVAERVWDAVRPHVAAAASRLRSPPVARTAGSGSA